MTTMIAAIKSIVFTTLAMADRPNSSCDHKNSISDQFYDTISSLFFDIVKLNVMGELLPLIDFGFVQ